MTWYSINNCSNGEIISGHASLADNFWSRLKGLLGRKTMPEDDALIIYPCNRVHCIGMQMDIDVLFVSESNEIVYIIEEMKPGRVSPPVPQARYVVELPPGRARRCGASLGDKIAVLNNNGLTWWF